MSSSVTAHKKELEELLAAACHFEHRTSKWNPKMRQYIYSKRAGIHIFDLSKTYACLTKALDFLRTSAAEGKMILLVSTKLHAAKLVSEAASHISCPYVTQKWMPGLLTNFDTIRKRIKYFKDLKLAQTTGEWDKYTKKERLELTRTLAKLENAFSGVEHMNKLPDIVVVFDSVRDVLALREAKRLGLKSVGVCDSNADPDMLTFPIPGNDDAVRSLKYFVEKVAEAITIGKKDAESAVTAAKPEQVLAPKV